MGAGKLPHRKDLSCMYKDKCFRTKDDCRFVTYMGKTPPECLLTEEQYIMDGAGIRHYGRRMKDDGSHNYPFRGNSKPSLTRREKKRLAQLRKKKCEK